MMIKKIAAAICAMAMTTAMLTACGDSDSSSKSDASSKKAETTTTTAAETEAPEVEPAESTAEGGDTSEAAPTGDEPYYDEVTGLEVQMPSGDYTAVTEFAGYDAFLMFADMGAGGSDWMWSNFSGQGYPESDRGNGAFGVDADVTGDGEYTVALTIDSIGANDAVMGTPNPQIIWDGDYILPALGANVFCVDITGICDGSTGWEGEPTKKNKLKEGDDANINKKTIGKYTGQEVKVELTSIKIDGEELEFDPTKIKYGNIEDDNNCYRIEIFNQYGDTVKDPPIDVNQLMFAKSLECTFTIEGLTEG
ncbi:MAG: hypothetical protein IJ571_07830 [Ruminococcus sp.]|nr:hypothetical protein [Ruminococcus sp.]